MLLLLIDTDLAWDSDGASGLLSNRVIRKCCKEGSPDMPFVAFLVSSCLTDCSMPAVFVDTSFA